MSEYTKVTKEQVFEKICYFCNDFMGPGIALPKYVARSLKTSRYQVDKYIKQLKEDGLIKYSVFYSCCVDDAEEFWQLLPIRCYTMTDEGKNTDIYWSAKGEREKELGLMYNDKGTPMGVIK